MIDAVADQTSGDEPFVRCAHQAMACEWAALIPHADRTYAQQAARAAFAEVDRLERELSRFIGDSDISRINAAAPGTAVRVSADTIGVLLLAHQLQSAFDGAIDVTIGLRVPRPGVGAPAAPPASGPGVAIHAAERSVTRLRADASLDLGAIGKGFALDAAVAVLREWGIERALLHSGTSSVYALGAGCPGAPTGSQPAAADLKCAPGWQLRLRDPADPQRCVGDVWLRDAALSGSAVTLKAGHIIDPRSGEPAGGHLAAWAIAPTAAVSDGVSTALMVVKTDEAVDCLRREASNAILAGVKAFVIAPEAPGVVRALTTTADFRSASGGAE
ncbi:MAG: FAD:protein FMN transferase [Planctomycetia bacterium]|nr:MAG: FAD:protein FMN transferase [Planctomycetia bacterium]